MRPIFTVHAGEFLVGQHIEGKLKKNVWLPTKDIGVDLLVTNAGNTKSLTVQVKFSRDFLPIMTLPPAALKALKSCTWFSVNADKLDNSPADYWILVLVGFQKRTYDFAIIEPKALLKKLRAIHGKKSRYDIYVWLTEKGPAWLTRGLKRVDQVKIAEGTFKDAHRDLTKYLSWSAIKSL
jgi:hypothetical protein